MPPTAKFGSRLLKNGACNTALSLVALGLLTVFAREFRLIDGVTAQDEGILLAYPDLILRGYIPYRDFAVLYLPGNFYLLAGAFQLFGSNVFVERSISFLYQFLLVGAVFIVGSRVTWSTGMVASAIATALLSLTPTPAAYSLFAALALAVASLIYSSKSWDDNGRAATKAAFTAGLLVGASLWFKQEIGAIAGLAVLTSLNPLDVKRVRPFFAGLLAPGLAMLAFAFYVGPANLYDSVILDVLRSAPGRVLPVPISPAFIFLTGCTVANLAIALLTKGARVPPRLLWLERGIAALSGCLLLTMIHRLDRDVLGPVGAPISGLTLVSLRIYTLEVGLESTKRAAAITAGVIVGTLAVSFEHATTRINVPLQTSEIYSGNRKLPLAFVARGTPDVDLQALIRDVNQSSSAGDTLFVGPRDLRFAIYNDSFLYYLLPHLRPSSRYLEMNPGCANRNDSSLADDVAAADWVILTSLYDNSQEPNASAIPGSSRPNEIVQRHFCSYSIHGAWQLFYRCAVGAHRASRLIRSTGPVRPF